MVWSAEVMPLPVWNHLYRQSRHFCRDWNRYTIEMEPELEWSGGGRPAQWKFIPKRELELKRNAEKESRFGFDKYANLDDLWCGRGNFAALNIRKRY